MSARDLALRAVASLAAVAALTGVGVLRLSRVPRPRAVAVARYADGAVSHERVTLNTQTIGYSLRCDGREVFARAGTRPLTLFEARLGDDALVIAGDGERALILDPRGCRVEIRSGVGVIEGVEGDANALRVRAARAVIERRR